MPSDAGSGAVLPLDLAAVASRVIADHVETEFGRPVVGRLVSQDEIRHVARYVEKLQTHGPLMFRHVQLVDVRPPHRPLAVSWEMIVRDRLPEAVRAAVDAVSGEPLDRLLTRHGVTWDGELRPEEGYVASSAEASCDLSWLEQSGAYVHLLRLARIGQQPLAVLINEVPLRASRPTPPPVLTSVNQSKGDAVAHTR